METHNAVQSLIDHLVSQYNATPNFESKEDGDKITAHFTVSVNGFNGNLDIVSEDAEWFRNYYPDGFEILRISNYQQNEMQSFKGKQWGVSITLEMLKKPEVDECDEGEDTPDEFSISNLSVRNKGIVDAILGDDSEERFAALSEPHRIILNKQMNLLHDLFDLSVKVQNSN